MTHTRVPATAFLLLASLSLFWGLNWPGMKIILSEMTVWWFRASCLVVGGSLLMLISTLSGNRCRLLPGEFPRIAFCGTFAVLGWMVCSAYGVSLMPAGRASIIAFTMPLWATLIAAPVLGESITANKIVGLGLGLSGLAVLIGPDLLILERAPVGAFFMLLAALSWGTGTVLVKHIDWRIPTLSNIAWQLLLSSVPVTCIAIAFEPLPDPASFSNEAIVALVYLFLFPMSFCQWAYFKTVSLLPASIAAIGTLTIPVIGVFSSHLIIGEPAGAAEIVALLLVIGSLALVLLVPSLRRRKPPGNPGSPPAQA